MNINRLLGTTLYDLYASGEKEIRSKTTTFNATFFSTLLIESLPLLHTITYSDNHMKYFLTIFARGVAVITEKEIDQHNMFEQLIIACLNCSNSKIYFNSGSSYSECFGQLFKFFIKNYPNQKLRISLNKYQLKI